MIASKVNEDVRLQNMPGNKSLTLRIDFSTENENLSPMMDVQNATFYLVEINQMPQLKIMLAILEAMIW